MKHFPWLPSSTMTVFLLGKVGSVTLPLRSQSVLQYILWIIVVLVGISPAGASSTHVLYGEHVIFPDRPGVYFDKDGTVYPDYFISDTSLERSDASLHTWYQTHPDEFLRIARRYNCTFTGPTNAEIFILQDSIFSSLRKKILTYAQNNSITFLMHGFRQAFTDRNGELSSIKNFDILKTTITKFRKRNTFFVEVYWDGCYDCCFSINKKHNDEILRLFEEAQGYALAAGQSLRVLLYGIPNDTINVVAYSLGAKVALESLFDIKHFNFPTPENTVVNICLVAPAIGGIETFEKYFYRHSSLPFIMQDNYKALVVYNEDDVALLKKDSVIGLIGPGPYKYGNTTLGCNYENEVFKVEAYFKEHYPNSIYKKIDLTGVGKCHWVSCYCAGDNMKSLVEFMEE